ncbi:MAG TPA: anthranilate phosphoribosyltransferase [Methylobacterium sp.]|jgi:anthranilate phosphoribosyltransferase|nr:anthranilate phosphoribosyltransferase [Methylobacterium sp.]
MNHNLAELLPNTAEDAAEAALARLYVGKDLGSEAAQSLFEALVQGKLSEPSIAAMLISLRLKGETVEELIGAARALRSADEHFPRPDYLFADTCGTGGDGSGSINVSTAVGFVAAASGLPVAKHGNRSVTSRCGSADVLEELGAKLDISAELSRRSLDETGFCFLFAPRYHPGLRHAGPVRRTLKVRTIMNILGPCVNPAEPQVQLLGIADPKLLEPVAQTLAALGIQNALVVHGCGLDEIALHGPTQAVRLRAGGIEPMIITPEDAGLRQAPVNALKGGGPEENAERLKSLLMGHGAGVEADMVTLNAGALLLTAGMADTLKAAVAVARDVLASGAAYQRLQAFVEVTNDGN